MRYVVAGLIWFLQFTAAVADAKRQESTYPFRVEHSAEASGQIA
jgi:hypothetical protein